MDSDRSWINMRYFVIAAIIFTILISLLSIHRCQGKKVSMPERMKQVLNSTKMNVYYDKSYHYYVRYPSFFEHVPDSLSDDVGACTFRYWDNWIYIGQSVNIVDNINGLSTKQGMDSLSTQLHATAKRYGKKYFILAGHYYDDSGQPNGYRYYSKYIPSQKIWFVQSLTYPDGYEKAVARLKKEIDSWTVWKKRPQRKLPFSLTDQENSSNTTDNTVFWPSHL